jgi:hypothetical protein
MSEVLWTELEKIDILRERMGLSYEEARRALDAAHGDLIKALANQEQDLSPHDEGMGGQLWGGLKHQMRRLSQTQVKLKRRDKTVLSVSAPLGLAVAYTIWRRPALRMLGLLGVAGAAMKRYELELDSVGKAENAEKEYEPYHYQSSDSAFYSESEPHIN